MKIVYLPGFGGNKNSETYQNLFRKYIDTEFIIYDNINAEIAYSQIFQQLENIKNKNVLIIGQSLGGFWAELFAAKNNWKIILINPSLEPFTSLKKYHLNETELVKFKNYNVPKITESKISIILSRNDTVVDPKPVLDKYETDVDFIYVDGDHKLENFEVLFEEIGKMKSY